MRKRTTAQRDRDLSEILELHFKGNSADEIARVISRRRSYSLGWRQVVRDIKESRRRWQIEASERIERSLVEALVRINQVERTYWQVFDNLGEQPQGSIIGLKASDCFGNRQIAALAGIERCIDRRLKLFGANLTLERRGESNISTEDVNEMLAEVAAATRRRRR